MNTIFNKIISIAVLSVLTFTLALPVGAAEPGIVDKVFQKIESVFNPNKGPANNQPAGQQPVGQNQPTGQGQVGGQGQFGQPMGQQQQPSGQNQQGATGQSIGQQQKGQGQSGQSAGSQTAGQNQPKGQSQFGQPSGQQPSGQGQSAGQQKQPSGQSQPGSQDQSLGQQLQGQGQFSQPGGQQQPSGQNQLKGQNQVGQPGGQQLMGQGQFGQPMGQQQQPMGQNVSDKNASEPLDNVSPVPENVSFYEDKLKLHEQERREALAEKYEKMKERYEDVVQKHEDARKHFMELREQYSAPNVTNRERIQAKMNEQAQRYLQNTVETMTQRVEMLERRVMNMPMIPVVGKEKIVSGLNNDIANLKEKLEDAKEADDAGTIKEVAKSIRDYWQGHDLKVKQVVGYTILGNTDKMVDKIESMGDALEKRVEELKTKGADVSKIEDYINEYQKLLDLVGQKRTEAETQFNSITSNVVSGVDAFHSGMKAVQDIKKLFGDVRDEMKNTMQEIKSLTKIEASLPVPEEVKTLEESEKNAE